MTHIAAIELVNWRRFRGRHAIELGEGVYGLVARWEGEEGRSNWAGKSAFLQAIAFAAVGWIPRGDVLDDCVTRGEDEAVVRVSLAEGGQPCGTIERRIRRGHGSELVVELHPALGETVPGRPTQARGGSAQEILDEYLVGFDAQDFLAGPFGRQKELDGLVRATPGQLMEKIGAWLDLDQLREAVELCRADANARRRERDRLNGQLEEARQRLAGLREGSEVMLPVAEHAHRDAELAYADARAEFERVAGVIAEREKAEQVAASAQAQLAHVTARGKELALAISAEDARAPVPGAERVAELKRELDQAVDAAAAAAERVRVAGLGSRGEFDGVCPVAGIACPATAEINAGCAEARAAAAAAVAEEEAAAAARRVAAIAEREARERRQKRDQDEEYLQKLRDLYEELDATLAEQEVPEDGPDVVEAEAARMKRDEASARRDEAYRALADMRAEVEQRRVVAARVDDLCGQVEAATAAMLLASRAAEVFTEAQRVVAEASLGEVEGLANRGLSGAGIPLSVEVRWRREARGLADECSACGQAFPRSKKVKECSACGQARGEKVDEYPQIAPSDRSGAADDMAGALVQMAAGAWLRGKRGAPWSTAILDEPTSAADPSNCRALALALRRLLCGPAYGYAQAIVSSHDQATQEAFERQIVVVAGPEGSRLEVR